MTTITRFTVPADFKSAGTKLLTDAARLLTTSAVRTRAASARALTAAGNIDVGEYGGTNTYAFSHFGDENILGTGGTKGTTACTLYLNHDKWWGTSSTGATPEIDTSGGDDQSWAGRYWKEIELVGDN